MFCETPVAVFPQASAAIALTDEALIGDDPTTYQSYAVLSCTSNTGCPSQWLFQIEAKTDIDGMCCRLRIYIDSLKLGQFFYLILDCHIQELALNVSTSSIGARWLKD